MKKKQTNNKRFQIRARTSTSLASSWKDVTSLVVDLTKISGVGECELNIKPIIGLQIESEKCNSEILDLH